MIVRAPGKLVLSGAYVVLDGAPAVVAAVDRYALADASRPPGFVGEELAAAFLGHTPPFVDVSSMRASGRKLGLGSSAAALVAAIAADRWRELGNGQPPTDDERDAVARLAFAAHCAAQGGGSGVDIVASAFGGVLACELREGGPPSHRPVRLPVGLVIEAWACPESASTAELLRPVRALALSDAPRYAASTVEARAGAVAFVSALAVGDAIAAVAAVRAQRAGMLALEAAAGVTILPSYLVALGEIADSEGAVFSQAGAGGGDVALFFGRAPSSATLRREAQSRGLELLDLGLGAPGVHAVPSNLLSTSAPSAPT